jgi:hypothetical protein
MAIPMTTPVTRQAAARSRKEMSMRRMMSLVVEARLSLPRGAPLRLGHAHRKENRVSAKLQRFRRVTGALRGARRRFP